MSTREFSKVTGCSLRQLQWWDEKGLLKPRHIAGRGGRGSVRSYGERQVPKALMLRTLLRSGPASRILLPFAGRQIDKIVTVSVPMMVGRVLVVPARKCNGKAEPGLGRTHPVHG